MRLFRINDNGELTEYAKQDFKGEHREELLEAWLESNPDSIIEDGSLLIVGRQVSTNLGSFIDLLAIDRTGSVAVLELKRDRTPRETLAQALEYASFAESLDYEQLEEILRNYTGDESATLSEYHRAFFALEENEAVSFNKDQRIVIIGQNIAPEIRQAAMFLRQKGVRVTCVEFNYFQTKSGERLLSSDIVVGTEPVKIATGSRITREKFLKSCDEAGRPVFEAILALSEAKDLPIHWGIKGFSLNVDLNGTHIALCFGYPPSSALGQSLYTRFSIMKHKVHGGSDLVASFRDKIERTGMFIPAGREEMKCIIQQRQVPERIGELTGLFLDLAERVRERGIAGSSETKTV